MFPSRAELQAFSAYLNSAVQRRGMVPRATVFLPAANLQAAMTPLTPVLVVNALAVTHADLAKAASDLQEVMLVQSKLKN